MGDIKWIKIYTDMVNNKKIKSIRKMPEGNNIVLIWVLLIAQAGESNKKGALYLTDTIPFTIDDLSVQLDFEKKVIQLALVVLEKYSMIEVFDEVIYIKNWEKYQNEIGMEKIREQTRVRVSRFRENQKLLECNVTVALPKQESNALELRTKNQEQDKEPIIKKQYIIHGEFKHVKLTDDELFKLNFRFGESTISEYIIKVDRYVESKKKPYKNYYAAILTWLSNAGIKEIDIKPEREYIEVPAYTPQYGIDLREIKE